MTEELYLGAYWGPRKESARSCAGRALRFLNGLAECETLFACWYQTGRSRKEALSRKVIITEECLEELFLKGVNRRDSDKSVIEDLGYLVFLWTEHEQREAVNLSFTCSCWFPEIPNSCVLTFPSQGESRGRLLQASMAERLLRLAVECWEPDWGTVCSHELRDAMLTPLDGIQVGWLTYVSSGRRTVPAMAPPSKVIAIDNRGWLIVTTEEQFSSSNPAHVEQARRIVAALRRARIISRKSRDPVD